MPMDLSRRLQFKKWFYPLRYLMVMLLDRQRLEPGKHWRLEFRSSSGSLRQMIQSGWIFQQKGCHKF